MEINPSWARGNEVSQEVVLSKISVTVEVTSFQNISY